MSELKIETNEALTRFLVFSYFGIDIEGKDYQKKDIIGACVRRAYLDMCRTLKLSDNGKNGKFYKDFSDALISKLSEGGTIADKRKNAYEVFSTETSDVKEKDKKYTKSFHFGQVQKWVNMALKYMWLLGLIEDNEAMQLDIPLDSYIMKAAEGMKFPTKKHPSSADPSQWKEYHENSSLPWSQLTNEQYDEIQKEIKKEIKKKKISPLEWENNTWIKQAKTEAGKKKSKEQKNEQCN